jgi:hypothetical protein
MLSGTVKRSPIEIHVRPQPVLPRLRRRNVRRYQFELPQEVGML